MAFSIDFLNPKKFPLSVNQCAGVALVIMSVFMLYTILVGSSLPLYAAVIFLTGWFVFYYPEVGIIVALVSTLWFERYFTLAPLLIGGTAYKLYPLDVILILVGASLLWHYYSGQRPWPDKPRFRRLDGAIILFGIVCIFGLARALFKFIDPALAFGTFKNYWLYAIMYLYVVCIFDNAESWARLTRWLLAGGLGVLIFLIYGLASGHGLWTEYEPLSTVGVRLLAQSHAFYLLLFGIWLMAEWLWPKILKTRRARAWIPWLLGLAALGLGVSLQRHLWLAAAALVVLWLIFLPASQRRVLAALLGRLAVVIGAFALVYVWIFILLFGRLPSTVLRGAQVARERVSVALVLKQEDSSSRWRLSAWRAGLGFWVRNPVFGTGLGQEIVGYDQTHQFTVAARELHNNYLGILIQLGIVGLGVVAYWFFGLLRLLARLWPAAVGDRSSFIFIWGSVALVMMMVFSVSIYWDTNFFVIWWWLALAAVRFAMPTGRPGAVSKLEP